MLIKLSRWLYFCCIYTYTHRSSRLYNLDYAHTLRIACYYMVNINCHPTKMWTVDCSFGHTIHFAIAICLYVDGAIRGDTVRSRHRHRGFTSNVATSHYSYWTASLRVRALYKCGKTAVLESLTSYRAIRQTQHSDELKKRFIMGIEENRYRGFSLKTRMKSITTTSIICDT